MKSLFPRPHIRHNPSMFSFLFFYPLLFLSSSSFYPLLFFFLPQSSSIRRHGDGLARFVVQLVPESVKTLRTRCKLDSLLVAVSVNMASALLATSSAACVCVVCAKKACERRADAVLVARMRCTTCFIYIQW